MAKKVVTCAEAIGEAPAPEQPVTGETVAEVPAETPNTQPEAPEVEPETTPEAPVKKPVLLTIQVNQIQRITFGDGSEYHATFGVHEITDDRLAANLAALLNRPHKRQIFIL